MNRNVCTNGCFVYTYFKPQMRVPVTGNVIVNLHAKDNMEFVHEHYLWQEQNLSIDSTPGGVFCTMSNLFYNKSQSQLQNYLWTLFYFILFITCFNVKKLWNVHFDNLLFIGRKNVFIIEKYIFYFCNL